jgi:outer membrane receptor protein involved in Fe transport
VGRAILLGNIDGVNGLVTVESLYDYLTTLVPNPDTLEYLDIPAIRPESVRTIEFGARTTLFEKLYVDAGYYYSFYKNFIGYEIGVDASINPTNGRLIGAQAYRVAANARDQVTTQGFSIGLTYYLWNKYSLGGNYSWNVLNTTTDDPIIPAYNTPEHKYNISFSGRDITIDLGSFAIPHVGFNINYKWIDGYLFEGSPQFTGFIDAYGMLDAQINKKFQQWKTTLKIGASNILNNEVYQIYGGPLIGRLGYISVVYDMNEK